jgi:hypothetical protein
MTPRPYCSPSAHRPAPVLSLSTLTVLLALLAIPAGATAQVRASERATVSQVVDGTLIAVDYSRPVARDRSELFGGVVHWGEVWTPGANAATVLELGRDVTIDGHPVPAGRWSVWMVVAENGPWELVLDPRDDLFHTQHPERADDQIRFPIEPASGVHVEVLTWSFPRVAREATTLSMAWGTTHVSLEIEVEPTPIPTIAAEQAAPYLGAWEITFHEESGEASPLLPFEIRYEESGSLIAALPFEEDGRQAEMLLIPRAEGVFQPAFLRDGDVFDVETSVFLEFEDESENGVPTAFAMRTDKDWIWVSGRRASREPEPAEIDVDVAELQRYVGTYAAEGGPPTRVVMGEAGLQLRAPRMGTVRLAPIGASVFRLEGVGAPVRARAEFRMDGDEPVGLTLRLPGDVPPMILARTGGPEPEEADAVGTSVGASPAAPSAEWLIASALLALPEPLRDGAEVRGWTGDGHLETLRTGSNGIICLANRPGEERFAAACYHAGLEPFMERGRELVRQGIEGARRNETRWREIEAGALPMPPVAMVYNLWLPSADFDPATTDPATGGRLHALYIPFATAESTGLSPLPGDGAWLMDAGTPSAHVMIAVPARR